MSANDPTSQVPSHSDLLLVQRASSQPSPAKVPCLAFSAQQVPYFTYLTYATEHLRSCISTFPPPVPFQPSCTDSSILFFFPLHTLTPSPHNLPPSPLLPSLLYCLFSSSPFIHELFIQSNDPSPRTRVHSSICWIRVLRGRTSERFRGLSLRPH